MATPDMAMMNGVSSRHTACKLCRDRKVRCGGEQPKCEKCRRAGEQCVYLPSHKPTKADLAQMVEALQKRLEQAEAYITQSKVSSGNTPTLSSSYHCDWPADPDAQTFLPSTHHTPPSTVPPGDASAALNGSSYPEPSYQEHNLQSNGSEFQESSQVNTSQQTPGREIDLAPFSVHGPVNFDPSNFDFCPQHGFGIEKRVNEETGAAILEPVTNFSLAIFRNQAEASVMASVVADYIAWLCKTPPGGGIALSEQPVYLGMLGTLEVRLRELCEVSQSRSNAALRELVASLEALAPPHGPMATRLGSLEEDLQREARERAEAFRSRYNPCALLSEQSRNTSP